MKKTLIPALVFAVTGMNLCLAPIMAQSVYQSGTGLDNASSTGAMSVDGTIHVPNGTHKMVSVSSTDENIRNVLHNLAEQGGFNLVMDDSVDGNVTVELKRVTLDQALQSVAELGDILLLPQKGNIFLAIARQAAQEKGLSRQLSKMIPVKYANATRLATMLNQSVFSNNTNSSSRGGSNTNTSAVLKVKADARTNSIVVVGTAQEIELAQATVSKLDVPRQRKTFYLSHANALDIATMLASSIFNDGTNALRLGQSTSSSSSATTTTTTNPNAAAMPSALRVERQDIKEGSGVNIFGDSSSSGSASAGLSSTVTLRGFAKTTDTLQVSPEGALIIPDTRQNSITIMGTAEQIALAESLIPTLDAQLPQVAIEASLIEITDTSNKTFAPQWGANSGQLATGFNNQAVSGVNGDSAAGLTGMQTVDPTDPQSLAHSGIVFSTNPLSRNMDYLFQIKTLLSKNKAKVLANPTIVATHDTEAIISIVDEILRRVTTTVSSGFATQTIEIGEAGIVMDILPKIGEDGTISMRIRPCISSPLNTILDNSGNVVVTLVSKRDLMAQNVRVKDGQTLVIGGLVKQTDNVSAQKLPGVGDLPIVSAMFRASAKTGVRSELVLLITPHIINQSKVTPVNAVSSDNSTSTGLSGGQ